MIDRSKTAQALAKAIAHKHAGNREQANEWAAVLVRLLECEGILTVQARNR